MLNEHQLSVIRSDLEKRHPPNHICKPNTRLVIEGYPRSSNSFAVHMTYLSAGNRLHESEIAHHTHRVDNLRLADAYGVPKVILIREPEDAILSFHIYLKLPMERCAAIYVSFYTAALLKMEKTAVVHFREVTGDFRSVVKRINAVGNFGIPEDQDFDAIRDKALALVRSRASKTSEEDAMRQVAAPNEKRQKIKEELRKAVWECLASNPEVRDIYERVIATAGLTL